MNIKIQSVHFDADEALLSAVREKCEKLAHFHDAIVGVDVYLKLDNVVHTIKDKVAEIKVSVPRHAYFVKHSSKTFEESFAAAYESMVNQIKRQKERLMAA